MFAQAQQPNVPPTRSHPFHSALASTHAPMRAGDAPPVMDARIVSVLEAVTRRPEKPQRVRYLAARLRLSPSRFGHPFKEETGQTFKVFLRAVRMARAKGSLKDPTLRIKEVAAAVGYNDKSDSSRDFRKQYGRSPSRTRGPSRSRFDQRIADLTNESPLTCNYPRLPVCVCQTLTDMQPHCSASDCSCPFGLSRGRRPGTWWLR